jgi:very-short-patch-repair endonuclease
VTRTSTASPEAFARTAVPPPPAPPPPGGREGGGETFSAFLLRRPVATRPGFSTRIRDAARANRNDPTPAEARLWRMLKGRQLEGRKFRRQQPMGPFIVDFYCSTERLVIEVDGSIHHGRELQDADRQAAIESLGMRVVRFTNDEVLFHLADVRERLRQHLTMNSPLPTPAPREGSGVGVTAATTDRVFHPAGVRTRLTRHLTTNSPLPTPAPREGEGSGEGVTRAATIPVQTGVGSPATGESVR